MAGGHKANEAKKCNKRSGHSRVCCKRDFEMFSIDNRGRGAHSSVGNHYDNDPSYYYIFWELFREVCEDWITTILIIKIEAC